MQKIFDGHVDTFWEVYSRGKEGFTSFLEGIPKKGHLDIPRAKKGGFCGGIFAICLTAQSKEERDPFFGLTKGPEGYEKKIASPISQEYSEMLMDKILTEVFELEKLSGGRLQIVKSYRELNKVIDGGALAALLHFEGAEVLKEDLSNLEKYYALGLRSLGINWSRPNVFGFGVPFKYPSDSNTGPGLTNSGKELIRVCNQKGILIDLAHITEQGFNDASAISDAPLVVSHSGACKICPCARNLTDEQIDKVGKSDGIIGVLYEPNMIKYGKTAKDLSFEDIIAHIKYIVSRVGVEHIGLGSDFDGADVPEVLGDAAGLQKLIQALEKSGFSKAEVEMIAFKNWIRVLEKTLK